MSTAEGRYLVNEMLLGGYIYCGGENYMNGNHLSLDQQRHWNYYNLKSLAMPLPSIPHRKASCVCGHRIWWQCYIMKPQSKPTDEMIIVGNCCIKEFTGGKLRTCSVCGESHKNRKYDLCNLHKPGKRKCKRKTKTKRKKKPASNVDFTRGNLLNKSMIEDQHRMKENPDMKDPIWVTILQWHYGYIRQGV